MPGGDTINAIKQAAEFGLTKSGQKLSPLLAFVTDIDSVGLETAQGLLLAEAFYWDLNDDTRAFSKRFMERVKRVPTSAQAGVYSSVMHYLKAVKAAGTTDSAAVIRIMKDMVLQSLDNGLLTITMNRPDRRNALNPEMTRGLVEAARRAAEDHEVRAVLLKGAGGTFCVGGDVKSMAEGRAPLPFEAKKSNLRRGMEV